MIKVLTISLFSSITLILFNELFYLINFTSFSFNEINFTSKYIYNIGLLMLIMFLIYLAIGIIIYFSKITNHSNRNLLVISIVQFIIIYFILNGFNLIKTDLQTILSLLLCVILSSYQFFYSIFYLNVVK